jgi:hypothetical protein
LDDSNAVFFTLTIVFGAIVLGGFCLVAYAFTARQRLRELAIRERIALIERGLVPAPEVDPVRFERFVSPATRAVNPAGQRYRSAGVMLMGLGVALVVLLAFAAGVPEIGVGIGGGLAALGAAVFFNGLMMGQQDPQDFPGPSVERHRTQPPPNVGP